MNEIFNLAIQWMVGILFGIDIVLVIRNAYLQQENSSLKTENFSLHKDLIFERMKKEE